MSGNENPFQSAPIGDISAKASVIVALLVSLVVVVGGYLGGCALDKFGSIGAIAIWITGGVVGFTAAKLVPRKASVGYALAIAVVVAFLVAETLWIRWNIKDVDSILAAAGMLPSFFQQYSVDSLVAAVFTFFGASSALRQAG